MGSVRGSFNPQLHIDGRVATETVEYAVAKVRTALDHAPAPVLYVRLRLRHSLRASVPGWPEARVDVDLNGVYVGARAAGPTMREAVDRMQDRLRARLARNGRR